MGQRIYSLKLTVAVASALTLVFAASASASQQFSRMGRATHSDQALAEQVAQDYARTHAPAGLAVNGLPLCGRPLIVWRSFGDKDALDAAAEAVFGECLIVFNSDDWNWPIPPAKTSVRIAVGGDAWPDFCTAMAHEWQHLILGPTYFAAVNPTDPAHSPNPRSLMYAEQTHPLRACVRAGRGRKVGTSPPRTRHPARSQGASQSRHEKA